MTRPEEVDVGERHNRRRTSRQPAGWSARYTVVSPSADTWYDCEVVDVSHDGAALELSGPTPLLHATLRVELRRAGYGDSGPQLYGQLSGRTCYIERGTTTNGIGVGIEWEVPSLLERDLLVMLMGPPVAAAH
jgi:hypothetical protein